MSGFTALNVEPEDILEEEIDDTKEIQIEEAFKLYQNALKLHSQGPEYYDDADLAYNELFQSEVFKYPEVVTDYGHEQLDEAITLPTPAVDQAPVPLLPTNAADSAANSLPQLIYLSYKNRGQFVLDVARHALDQASPDRRAACLYYYQFCKKSLKDSASALERDDTDLDLWKKSARISDVLSSQRLVRFCLESVVAGDDETGEQTVDLSGLDEAFASGELLKVLQLIQDDTAVSRLSLTQAQEHLLRMLQKSNDPYPFLPQRATKLDHLYESQRPNVFDVRRVVIELEENTQIAFASALSECLEKTEAHGAFALVLLPSDMEEDLSFERAVNSGSADTNPQADVKPTEEIETEKVVSSNESARSPASYHSAQDEVRPEPESNQPEHDISEEADLKAESAPQEVVLNGSNEQTVPEMRLPTRKRSSTAAGNEEPESRTKSKRLRARESLMEVAAQEEEIAQEQDYYAREQLVIIEDGDTNCLSYINQLLRKINHGGDLQITLPQSQQDGMGEPEQPHSGSRIEELLHDMRKAVDHWSEDTNTAIMSGHGSRDTIEKSGGMALFQRHLKAALPKEIELVDAEGVDETMINFTRSIDQHECTVTDVAVLWLMQLLTSSSGSSSPDSCYLRSAWPSEMKENIMHVISHTEEFLFSQIQELIRSPHPIQLERVLFNQKLSLEKMAELTQTIFELQLDEYYSTPSHEGQKGESFKAGQRERLQRWCFVLIDVMHIYAKSTQLEADNKHVLRYALATTLFTGLLADDDKAHTLSCLRDVRMALEEAGNPILALPNNKVMPQVSIAAVDQEVSRLSTLDFFNGVFESDNSDPVTLITRLEPLLEYGNDGNDAAAETQEVQDTSQSNQVSELRSFLDSGDASLKLFLWRRLQTAYVAISYTPKVVSCLLRSLDIIVHEISTDRHQALPPHDRQLTMLRWLRDADELMIKILSKLPEEAKAFETLDEGHLHSSLATVTTLLGLLYVFVKYDDSVRVGQTPAPSFRTSSATKLFEKGRDKLRDMFVRGFTLLYHLLKETTIQLPDRFERPIDQLAEYLRLVHHVLGHRQYCKQCNKIFVKLAKSELLSIKSDIDYSEDIAQILYDMYQIRLGIGLGDANHGCTADALGRDKDTAFNLVPVIMSYTRKLSMKELIKSELKGTIDKIQQTLGQVKTSPALSFNRKAVSSFLKSPINPQEVYRSLKGMGDLLTRPVQGEYAKIASLGWYQVLGNINLAKYKSIKRVNPTPTDDLDTAATFLRLDIEHNVANWESWFRLAQVFDSKIEDSLIWNSLKINDSRGEIAALERNAINAYTMATAMAMRYASDNVETVQKISEMYSEFAFRLYASSRPPLDMEVFSTDKHMRHLSSSQDQSMSKAPFIFPFKPYAVWSFAAYLLRRKFTSGQKEWLCYYTLGKCLWKMFQSPENSTSKKPVLIEDVLEAFTDAVDLVPAKEKSADYILEPHYKLVSVIHKLVNRKLLLPAKGVQYLQATPFARAVHLSQEEQDSEWDTYILEILRKLGHADKSNWHHRITARAAHINFDDDPSIAGALGAKHQFTQQIFTKTMTMQVWKPEYERPGRHYVYTGRYLSFFVHLLDRLNDRASMEQLVRRIRRKITDFLDHSKVWEETALTYVKLLRRVGKVPDGKERALFDKISFDEFSKMSDKVEKWAHNPESMSPFQDIVQDTIELKKLNNSLMKGPAIDDLIGDAYACMYEAFVSQLPPEEAPQTTAAVLPQGTFINMGTDVVPTGDDNLDRMRLNNLLSAQSDGSGSGLVPLSSAIGLGLNTPSAETPPPELVRIPTPSKPGRTKTITRREVQRKAEACLVKPPTIKTPTLARRPFINIPGRRDSTTSNLQEGNENERSNADDMLGDNSRMSSRRPSTSARGSAEPDDADRDADDESELSDPDNNDDDDEDSKHNKPIDQRFAELLSRKRKAEDENGDRDEDGEGDGDVDVDMDGDENDEEVGTGDDAQEQEDDNEEDEEPREDEPPVEPETGDMDVDEQEDGAIEIPDSQEPTETKVQVQPTPRRTPRRLQANG